MSGAYAGAAPVWDARNSSLAPCSTYSRAPAFRATKLCWPLRAQVISRLDPAGKVFGANTGGGGGSATTGIARSTGMTGAIGGAITGPWRGSAIRGGGAPMVQNGHIGAVPEYILVHAHWGILCPPWFRWNAPATDRRVYPDTVRVYLGNHTCIMRDTILQLLQRCAARHFFRESFERLIHERSHVPAVDEFVGSFPGRVMSAGQNFCVEVQTVLRELLHHLS